MSYFRNFPEIQIPINGAPISVKDIIRRVKIPNEVFQNESNYAYYRLSDGETLKDVARQRFGDPSLDWAIILFNGLTDPLYSAPLTTNQFEDFVESKYDGQSLFCSAPGSSLPFFLNEGSFDIGDFIAEKTVGSNGERIFTDDTKNATIKKIDTSLAKIEVTKQLGNFSKGDLLVNRTQFEYTPENTVQNLKLASPDSDTQTGTFYNIPIGFETLTTQVLWNPKNNNNGQLSAWYQPSGIGSTLTNGLSGSGGVTLERANTWTNSSDTKSIDLSCVTADFMPLKGNDGYNGYPYVECNLSTVVSGNTQGSRMSFANSRGNFGITQHDFMICMMMQFKDADKDLAGLVSIPSRSRFADGAATRTGYPNRSITGLLGNMDFSDPNFSGPVLSQRFHSLQTDPVDKHCPITKVPPRVRPFAKPNIICIGRSGGGTGNAKPFFRINGQPAQISGGAGDLTTISFVDLTKVEATDNVDFFALTDSRDSIKQFIPFEGQMYEMIIYNGFTGPAANVNDLAEKTEGYLAHKFGKQNEVLSALHTYRVNPPLIDNTILIENNATQVNGNIGVNPGADGDERVIRVDKVVSGPDAPKRFVLNPGATTEFVLNPLASPPDSNNQQTTIGMTSSSFDSGLSAVTYGSTILYNYIYNNDASYVQTNKMYEESLNEKKRIIRVPRKEFLPVLVQAFQRAIKS